jgi:hypothetical protein
MKRLVFVLIFLLSLSSPAWARPVKWKKPAYLVTDDTLDAALARAEAQAETEFQNMEMARVRAKAKARAEYKAMEEARAKAAKPAPRLPH